MVDQATLEAPDGAAAEPQLETGAETPPDPIEAIAAEKGWTRKDSWRGKEEDWRPADEFIKIGLDRGRSAASDVRSLRETMQRTERTLEQMHRQTVERAVAEATAVRDAAMASGDTKAAIEADRQIARVAATPSATQPAPEAADFRSRNAWFDPNGGNSASLFALTIAEQAARAGKPAAQQIAEAEEETRKRFPEMFGEPASPAKPPAAVSAPNTRTTAPARAAKGFNDLPAAAQETGRRMAGKMGFTLEDYAKTWHAENAA